MLATPDGTWFSKADGINNLGQVVGDIGIGEAVRDNIRAAYWATPDSYELIAPENGFASFADVISDSGWIGGIRYDTSIFAPVERWQAYVRAPDGKLSWVTPKNAGYNVEFYAINSSNLIAGFEFLPEDPSVSSAIVWSPVDGVVYLPGNGGFYTSANGINDPGIVVGVEYDGDITDQPLWWNANREVQLLPLLSGKTSGIPTGINSANLVVGYSGAVLECDFFADRTCRTATLWTLDGAATDLNSLIDPGLGVRLLWANGINDRGDIYGEAIRLDGSRFVFQLNAVPEPASWALLIAGFGIVGVAARRRRHPRAGSAGVAR